MEHLAKKLINWASILEPNTREQALRTASMPFIWPHVALMSDAHLGKGSTVGSVIPTLDAIMPAAVGVDIGCGMIAVRTDLVHDDLRGKVLARKGAIDAAAGKPGLIPGSMGTASYVVTGKGNKLSLNSSPHGAGREYSRSAARRTFTRAQLEAAMQGIEWRHTDAFLDEIPGARKDIDRVMADAADLVEVRHTLRQIVNVKGE
jgi:RNA-splicing ligase RtcB